MINQDKISSCFLMADWNLSYACAESMRLKEKLSEKFFPSVFCRPSSGCHFPSNATTDFLAEQLSKIILLLPMGIWEKLAKVSEPSFCSFCWDSDHHNAVSIDAVRSYLFSVFKSWCYAVSIVNNTEDLQAWFFLLFNELAEMAVL